MVTRLVALVAVLTVVMPCPAPSQERFSFFQASTPESVQQMLTLAELRDDDVVVDLGSGDGLIPLMAARMNPRLRAWGMDVNAQLVEESNQRARTEGVADRVRFEHGNAFDADLSDATVVTMWLFPELMRLLRPVILERARPGTRVLTSTWDLGSWKPDQTSTEGTAIHLWIVPARVGGYWDWDLDVAGRQVRYASVLEQRVQEVEGVVRAGDRRELFHDVTLRGEDVSFTLEITLDGLGLTQHAFSGKVRGDRIEGTVTLTPADRQPMTLRWQARRVEESAYFAHTGTTMFEQPAAVR